MKTDAATVRIEYGRGEQMVQVDKHGKQKNNIYLLPIFTKK